MKRFRTFERAVLLRLINVYLISNGFSGPFWLGYLFFLYSNQIQLNVLSYNTEISDIGVMNFHTHLFYGF